MKLLAPLRLPAFRRLYAAQVVANTGDGLDYLAIVTIVIYQWERGAGALSLLALCAAVPLVAGAPFFGLLADRFEPRWVMLAANTARAAGTLGIALTDELAAMCALSVVVALGGGSFGAAQQRFIRYHVSDELLLQANSLRSTTERLLTGLAGPGLAGLLITLIGARSTLYFTAGCFAVAAVMLGSIARIPPREDGGKGAAARRGRMTAGFRYVRSHPALRLTIVGMAIAYTFSMMFDVLLPVWYREMGGGPGFVGTAMMSMGLGGAAGAILAARVGDRFNLMKAMAVSSLGIGALVGLMGVVGLAGQRDLLGVWLVCVAAVGVASAVALVGYSTLVQRLTPPDLMGRVAALSGAALTAPTVVGPSIAPGASALFGVSGVFAACGAGLAVLGVVILLRARHYDLTAVPAAPPGPEPVAAKP